MVDASKILVLGSIAHETLLIPDGGSRGGYRQQAGWVGAPLLREMISQALVELPHDPARSEDDTKLAQDAQAKIEYTRVRPDEPSLADPDLVPACVHITTVFKRVPKTSKPRDPDLVLRVSKEYSSYPPEPKPKDKSELEADAASPLARQMQSAIRDCDNPEILVLFDFSEDGRKAARASLPRLADGTGRRTTIVGFARELHGKALGWLEGLTPAVSGGAERTVAVLRAEELRKAGQIIVESGPIERTVRDVVASLEREPLSTIKKHASQLVVLFEEIGAVHLNLTATCGKQWMHLSSNLDTIAHEGLEEVRPHNRPLVHHACRHGPAAGLGNARRALAGFVRRHSPEPGCRPPLLHAGLHGEGTAQDAADGALLLESPAAESAARGGR